MSENLFEIASRQGYRYPTIKGDITTDDLWDLPLTSTKGVSLDSVAIAINEELQEAQSTSFVVTTVKSLKKEHLARKLEVVKHVIAYKMDLAEKQKNSAEKQEKKRIILEAIANKQKEGLNSMSEEELKKALTELSE